MPFDEQVKLAKALQMRKMIHKVKGKTQSMVSTDMHFIFACLLRME